MDPDPQKINADPQPRYSFSHTLDPYIIHTSRREYPRWLQLVHTSVSAGWRLGREVPQLIRMLDKETQKHGCGFGPFMLDADFFLPNSTDIFKKKKLLFIYQLGTYIDNVKCYPNIT